MLITHLKFRQCDSSVRLLRSSSGFFVYQGGWRLCYIIANDEISLAQRHVTLPALAENILFADWRWHAFLVVNVG